MERNQNSTNRQLMFQDTGQRVANLPEIQKQQEKLIMERNIVTIGKRNF